MKAILLLLLFIPTQLLASDMEELIELQREQLEIQKEIIDNQKRQIVNRPLEPTILDRRRAAEQLDILLQERSKTSDQIINDPTIISSTGIIE